MLAILAKASARHGTLAVIRYISYSLKKCPRFPDYDGTRYAYAFTFVGRLTMPRLL